MLRYLRLLGIPLVVIWAIFIRPIQNRARKRILKKHGWLELKLDGQVVEMAPFEKLPQQLMKKLMNREDPPRVVMSRMRRFTKEVLEDKWARGVLVRIDSLQCGYAMADALRRELATLREAKKEVIVHIARNAGNLEMLVASAGTKIYATPVGALASVGASSVGLFMADTLERLGMKMEVVSRGRFKSAPERFTRTERSEADEEQTRAIIDEIDRKLVQSFADGRRIPEPDAVEMIDACPVIGSQALEAGMIDGIARDEDLGETVQQIEELDEPPKMIGAGRYLDARTIPPIFPGRKKKIGIVNVHGAIVDRAPPQQQFGGTAAVEKAVVNDLREALEDKNIAAVVLHVNSRGGSVTASDAIYSAVKRLDQEKPVIACFGDVAASGGYYVACGARSIVCDPLTITGSIGVFSMMPTFEQLTQKVAMGTDVVLNRRNAALFNPWQHRSEESTKATDAEVGAMYDRFLDIVGEARGFGREEADENAQGRVWTGRAARERRLVDSLGGMEEALRRAAEEATARVSEIPVLVSAKGNKSRPAPFTAEAASIVARWVGNDAIVADFVTMVMSGSRQTVWAYSPISF